MKDSANEVLEHLTFLARHIDRSNIPAVTMLMLIELDIPFGTLGFDHLETGIVAFSNDSAKTLAAGIYETIISSYDIKFTKDAIEQAIRASIGAAWEIKDVDVWKYYFSPNVCDTMKKPANVEFITRLGRYLRLWKACCKEAVYDGRE